MSSTFTPRLDILPDAQLRLWADLGSTPGEFTLYGGTAIALHLGHRRSLDFDFFARTPFEPDALLKEIPYLKDAVVRQASPNTLTTTVDRGGPVQVSFFGGLNLGQVEASDFIKDPNLTIASLIDLAGTNAKVIIQRVEPKDYIDIHALITQGGIPLQKIVAAASVIFGPQLNPLDALKAIAYHQDSALTVLSDKVKTDLVEAVQATDPENLPAESDPGVASRRMKPLPHKADLIEVAPRVIWFEPAETALADPVRFLTYLMTYGTIEEIRLVMRYVDFNDLREALEHAPPGIMDARSWAYWNMRLGRYPVPPMPRRQFRSADDLSPNFHPAMNRVPG